MKITKPTLLVNKTQVRANIQKMIDKSKNHNLLFRPHFKTHQSKVIGQWFRDQGVSEITVSSVDMAKYFAEDEWKDITIAIPVNILQLDEINELASTISLGVLIESVDSANQLIKQISNPLCVWIEVDQGYHRTGVQNTEKILEIVQIVKKSNFLTLTGLLTHAGHSYTAKSIQQLEDIHRESIDGLLTMQQELVKHGYDSLKLSIGDTPTCSIVNDFQGIDEIRPGNFVFYDLTQLQLGACQESEISIGIACPVIAKYSARNQVVIYGGTIHLSKEKLINSNGVESYGKVAILGKDGEFYTILGSNVISLSQEHGVLTMTPEVIKSISIGDLLIIIPVHSCISANLHHQFITTNGEILTTIHKNAHK
ncbi:MAG: alanine racemase [Candidatus Heimdallarchaeota archaeon]|nr:alanine racemase [Candidatus Heimdallarchaeota archaeon]